MSQTVGEFLREKAGNMHRWLKEQDCPVDIPELGSVAAVTFAQRLRTEYATAIDERDFDALMTDKENFAPQLLMTIAFVQRRPPLHDKFWRYLELFSDAVA